MAASRLSLLRPSGGDERLQSPDAVTRRELYFFELYRLFEAAMFVAFCCVSQPWLTMPSMT